jgi:Mrp family chromosome partitioning ATPase
MNKPSNKNEEQISGALSIPAADGTALYSFPIDGVNSIRRLITRISRGDGLSKGPKRISVVSALRGEGVTFISLALGATIANDLGAQVCVVDLNWWGTTSRENIVSNDVGLAAAVQGETQLSDTLIATGWSNLSILPAGWLAKQDRPIVARSSILEEFIQDLSEQFNYLILDIPAILSTSDAVPLASLGTSCCMVVRQGVTRYDDVQLALDEIDHLNVLGIVLNQEKISTPTTLLKLFPV